MKKRFPRFQILFIGGIFFLLGTNFLAILFPNNNQNHKNYWYSSVGFELVSSAYADDDEGDHEDKKRERRSEESYDNHDRENHDNDREDHDDDDDNYYYTPPTPQPPADNNPPTPPPTSNCRTVYDTVTSASGVSSQVPRQVCDTTPPTTPPIQTPVPTPPPAVPPTTQPPVDNTTPTNPSNNCRTVYDTVYDTVTTASGTQVQEPRQVSKQVCDTTTPPTTVVVPEKVVTPPAPVTPTKPIIQKKPETPITGIYKDGTYTGDGYYSYVGGSVTYTVSLTFKSSKITEAHFLAFTPSGNGKYTRADGDATLATLVRLQNASIDTVTGATGTSQAIQDAINVALKKAKGENITTNPPVASPALEVSTTSKPVVSPSVQPTLVQSSDNVAPVYVSESQAQSVSPETPDTPETIETFTVPSDEIVISSPSLSQENEVIPTSRLVERIATKDGKAYSIIKNLESGKYILLDEKNGERDPHTFQFKEDVIAYAIASQETPKTFIEMVFQFFTSLFSESPETPSIAAESPVITKTQLLAQADLQARTMKQKALKQKVAEAIAQFEMQKAQKSNIVPSATTQQKTVQVSPKKSAVSVVTPVSAQKSVPKKSPINTVTQAS